MARALRFVYPGAVYHVMARGDGGKKVFLTDGDHLMFLDWLERACTSHGWRVHAWVLMGNHFHLLLETPEPNLVSGMKLLLGSYGQAWNRRHKRHGHVFQGRYKSIPVAGEAAADPYHFRMVADYIHLNPARAGLVDGKRNALADYRWSSLGDYARGRGPDWLVCERVLAAFDLAQSGRGRRAYVEWLEIRARDEGGKLSAEAMKALRRGWYLGDDSFRDRLLNLIEKPVQALRSKGSHSGLALGGHGEHEAERIVALGLAAWGLPEGRDLHETIRKGDARKVALATVAKRYTSVSNLWLAQRLGMGHDRSVSRLIRQGADNDAVTKWCRELVEMLPCED